MPGTGRGRVLQAARIGLLCLALALAGAGPGGTRAGSAPAVLEPDAAARLVDPLVGAALQERGVAGAVLSVVRDGETVLARGYGLADVAAGTPASGERTVFRIGSITKVFTAVAVLQLVDRGLLELDDDVNRHLTTLQVDDRFPEPVRVRHLLTHTAGFDQLGLDRHVESREEVLPLEEFLRANLVRVRPPDLVTCYDTYGIVLAGRLVEAVSGMAYEEYLRQRILEPTGMERSAIYLPGEWRRDVATGYDAERNPQRWEFMNTDPASSLNSTAADMARFMRMLLAGGVIDGRRVLSVASAGAMMRRQFGNHPALPGFTLSLFEHEEHGIRSVGHGGSMTGFAASMRLFPGNRTGIFLALNREDGGFVADVLGRLIGQLVANGSLDPRLEDPWRLEVDTGRFAGTYADNMRNHTRPEQGGWGIRPFEVEAEAGGIRLRGQLAWPEQPLLFRRADGAAIAFREDAGGAITHMFVDQTTYDRLPPLSELGEPVAPAVLAIYAGTYETENGTRVHIRADGDRLLSEEPDEPPARLVSLGHHTFQIGYQAGWRIRFVVETGRSTGFRAHFPGRETTATRVDD